MTQVNQTSKNTVLEAFLKQRAKRQNSAAVEAKRLVNLYRQLSLFGDDFLDTYNDMLLAATPEVQMALPDIVGGTVVRQYLEFLKGRSKQSDTDSDISEEAAVDAYQYRHAESYLPTPDEVPPFSMNTPIYQAGGGETGGIDATALTAQMTAFERALEQQNAFLTQALTQLQQNMTAERSAASDGQSVDGGAFYAQKEMLTELLTRQNEQMNANINAILSQTQEMSARQMEAVEKLIQKHATPDPYAVIEEEGTVNLQPDKMTSRPSYAPRYRVENTPSLHQTEVELEPVGEGKENISVNETGSTPKRYSSVSLNEYYAEPTETPTEITTPDWKG